MIYTLKFEFTKFGKTEKEICYTGTYFKSEADALQAKENLDISKTLPILAGVMCSYRMKIPKLLQDTTERDNIKSVHITVEEWNLASEEV